MEIHTAEPLVPQVLSFDGQNAIEKSKTFKSTSTDKLQQN
jgi:hypothetical protein